MNDVSNLIPDPNCRALLHREFHHLRDSWCWLLCYGILLAVTGTIAIVVPAMTVTTTFAAMIVLGLVLMGCGVATILTAYWAGKCGAQLLQLFCGVLYIVSGYVISDEPEKSAALITALIASAFIVLGLFRTLASLTVRFPFWGWSLLNGVVTLMCGVAIYRHFRASALWVVGLLIGLEMLFHGWNWIMVALAVRQLPESKPTASTLPG